MGTDEVKEEEDEPKIYHLGWVLWWVFLAWAIISLIFYGVTIDDWEIRGQFGDMFGSVNSLFSGLAFAGLIYTIFLQRNELHLQRVELKETRKVFEKQSFLMENQRNISVFFSMIENHRSLINSYSRSKTISKSNQDGHTEDEYVPISGHEELGQKLKSLIGIISNFNSLRDDNQANYLIFYKVHPIKTFESATTLSHTFLSIKSIIVFIYKHLDNLEMYHEIFFNSLNNNEKYILNIFAQYNFKNSLNEILNSGYQYLNENNSLNEKYNKIDLEIIKIPLLEILAYSKNNFFISLPDNYTKITIINREKVDIYIENIKIGLNKKDGSLLSDSNKTISKKISPGAIFVINFEEIFTELFYNTKTVDNEKEKSVYNEIENADGILQGKVTIKVIFNDVPWFPTIKYNVELKKNATESFFAITFKLS